VETAVSVAIILASTAVFVVAVLMIVALWYIVFILRRVADSAKQLKKTARAIGNDVQGAVKSAMGVED